MKDRLFNLVPPAMVAMVVLFWSMGPKVLVDNGWTIIVIGPLITGIVLGLEFVHERHEGWRMNWQEFSPTSSMSCWAPRRSNGLPTRWPRIRSRR
jgi:hypothetical protein